MPVLARFPKAPWGAEERRTQIFELLDREIAVHRDMWRILCCFNGGEHVSVSSAVNTKER